MNLYQLTSNFVEIDRLISEYLENGEEDLAENLVKANEIIAEEIKNKSNGFVYVFRNVDSQIESIDAEIKRLQELKKQKQSKYESLKKMLKDNMELIGTKKLETDLGNISIRNNPGKVNITNETLIPDTYKEIIETVKVDKKAILKDVKAGMEIDGVAIEYGTSLTVPKTKK